MSQRSFFVPLSVITLVFGILAFTTSQIPSLSAYTSIFWLSIIYFFVLSIAMYFLARKAATSENKYAFTNVVIGFTAGKLLLAIVLLVIYKKLAVPEDAYFVIPFLVVYLVYTAFETKVMLKLGRIPNQAKSE